MFGQLNTIQGIVIPTRHPPLLLENKPEVLFSRPYNRVCPEGMSEIDEPQLLQSKRIEVNMIGNVSRTSQHAQHYEPAS